MTLEHPQSAAATTKLWDLLERFDVVMLTSVADGTLRSRPMHLTVDRDGDCLWFISRAGEPKVAEVHGGGPVNVACADPKEARYVSVSGEMDVLDDREKLRELWSPFVDVWFEGGPDDADAVLLKMRVDRAEFWDGEANRLVQYWELAKAKITGDEPDLADHRRVP